MATPGDKIFKIGTIHLNAEHENCVVEVETGIQTKDGPVATGNQNVVVPWDRVSTLMSSLTSSVATALSDPALGERYTAPTKSMLAAVAKSKADADEKQAAADAAAEQAQAQAASPVEPATSKA